MGRYYPSETEPIRDVVEDWTGVECNTCPWRSFHDPFVVRVLEAYNYWESGLVNTRYPDISHRLIEGLGYYHQIKGVIEAKQQDLEEENR